MNYKLIALFGPAGSGKDYILWNIQQTDWGKAYLHRLIPSTTRPPRKGEKDGINYHFLPTSAEFFNWNMLGKWVDFNAYNTWWYGTSIDEFQPDKINIGIFTPRGINQILQHEEIECLPIYIKATDKTRLLRQLNREDDPNCAEIVRRFTTDRKDFLNLPFHYYIIENNYDEVKPIINEIFEVIRGRWSDMDKMI